MKHTIDDERARDHLANERTYLAWLRTGMSMMGLGVVIAKLRYLFAFAGSAPASPGIMHASNIGLIFSVIGLMIVMLSGGRYLVVQNQIRQKRYHSSRAIIVFLSIIVTVLGFLVIWYVLQDMAPGTDLVNETHRPIGSHTSLEMSDP